MREPMQSVSMEEVFLIKPPYRLDITLRELEGRREGRILPTVSLTLSLFGPVLDAIHAVGVKASTDLDFVSDATYHIELGCCRGCLLAEYLKRCGCGFGNDARELVHFVADFETLPISISANKSSSSQTL